MAGLFWQRQHACHCTTRGCCCCAFLVMLHIPIFMWEFVYSCF